MYFCKNAFIVVIRKVIRTIDVFLGADNPRRCYRFRIVVDCFRNVFLKEPYLLRQLTAAAVVVLRLLGLQRKLPNWTFYVFEICYTRTYSFGANGRAYGKVYVRR